MTMPWKWSPDRQRSYWPVPGRQQACLNIIGNPSANLDPLGKMTGTQLMVSVTVAPRRGKATDPIVPFLVEPPKWVHTELTVPAGTSVQDAPKT